MYKLPERKKKFKDTGLPPDLQEQWEKDRSQKAENKRKRQLARLEAAADPMTKKKGGKKGIKAMLAAARVEEDGPIELPNRVVNLSTLEQQIRRFIEKRGGPSSMTLPPCDKATRKKIHELADAFSLKSQSKGKGVARYTTLTKTSYTGTNIREGKVKRILREDDGDWGRPSKKGRTPATSLAKHREGEEVGKVRFFLACFDLRTLAYAFVSDCSQDRREQRWFQVARCHGLGGRRADWFVRWFGCTVGSEDEEDEVGPWGYDVLISH